MRKIEGEKRRNVESPVFDVSAGKNEVTYPHFYISIKHLPEAKDWKIGSTYDVTLRLRQVGMSIRQSKGEDRGDADFEIIGIDPKGAVSNKPEKSPGKRYSRVKSK